jgi:ribosomal protein S18 acetylase RimI-like enzyme
MSKNFDFQSILSDKDIRTAAEIIRKANEIVAKKIGLTRENAPTNPAFITPESLRNQISNERNFYLLSVSGEAIGTVAVEKAPAEEGLYYIERLAVLPDRQGRGYGKSLMEFAFDLIQSKGGKTTSVAIINENPGLKEWYGTLGFIETGLKRFEHLPFTVCFMKKELA